MTNTMPKTGRIVLTPMLNERGKLIGDFTIAKAGDDRFMIWGSSAAQRYHMRWFEKHLPADGSVRVQRLDMKLVGLSIAGPKRARRAGEARRRGRLERRPSASWTSARWTSPARPAWSTASPIPATSATRSGWSPPTSAVYRRIKEAGEEFGIVDFGMRALLSMRLEKNFPTWFRELRPIYGPFEGGHGALRQAVEERLHRPRGRRQGEGGRPEAEARLASSSTPRTPT